MEASPLCRCHVLRCWLHSSGHRTEEHESDCGIPDPQPGILHLRPGRMDHPRSETKYKRNHWMRHYVCRNYPRPAPAETERIKNSGCSVYHYKTATVFLHFYSTSPLSLRKCSFILAKVSSLRSCSILHASSFATSGLTPRRSNILLSTVCLS